MKKEMEEVSTRRQQFKSIIKVHTDSVFTISIIVGLFAIPLFVGIVWSRMSGLEILSRMNTASVNELQQLVSELFSLYFTSSLILVPCFMLFAVGLGGGFSVMKHIVWRDNIHFKENFLSGLKNYKSSLLLGFLCGLVNMSRSLLDWYTLIAIENKVWLIVITVIETFVIALVCISVLYAFSLNSVYKLTIFQCIKNSVILTFSKILHNLAILIAICLPVLILLIDSSVIGIVIVESVFWLFYMGVSITLFVLYSYSRFDVIINKDSYPQLVNKGLKVIGEDK